MKAERNDKDVSLDVKVQDQDTVGVRVDKDLYDMGRDVVRGIVDGVLGRGQEDAEADDE